MIRVAHLLPNLVTGGRERIVADLCAQAAAQGIQPHIVTYDPAGDARQVDVGDTPVLHTDRALRGIAAWLADERIDILHAQGHVAAALARPHLFGTPMIATLHVAMTGTWRWSFPIARGLRAAAAVTAVSDDLAQRFARLASRPIAVIPTGVDLTRFTPIPPREPGTPFRVGIAARLHPVKRHEDALAALRLIPDVQLVIAGQGDRRAALEAKAASLDVEFAGGVADMPAWLATLDAFLLCSDHEGTPAALLEAMACGLPCVATHIGGIPSLTGDAALLVPPRNPPAIAAALHQIACDAPLRARLRTESARRAHQFTATAQANAYTALYRDVLNRHAGKAAA